MTQQQKSADTFDILLDLKNILCKETVKPKRLHAMIPLIMFKKLTLYGATVWRAGAITRELSGKHTKAPSFSFPFFLSLPLPPPFPSILCSGELRQVPTNEPSPDSNSFCGPVLDHRHVPLCTFSSVTAMTFLSHWFLSLLLLFWEEISHCPGWPPSPEYFLNSNTPYLGSGDNTAICFTYK